MIRKVCITVTLDGNRGGFTLRTDTVPEGRIEIGGRVDMPPDDRSIIMECAELIDMIARDGTGSYMCRGGLSELTSALLCMVSRGAAGNLAVTDVRKEPDQQ